MGKILDEDGFCTYHKRKDKELTISLLFKWFDKQEAKGLKQKRCKVCGKWLYPSEF